MSVDTAALDDRNLEDWETLVWDGKKAPPDQQIDQFMILARQVIARSNNTNTNTDADKMLYYNLLHIYIYKVNVLD